MRSTMLYLTDPNGVTIEMVIGDEDFRGEYVCDTFKGLPDGLKIRGTSSDYLASGSTVTEIYRDSRYLTLGGWARFDANPAGSAAVLRRAQDLTALWPDGSRLGELRFEYMDHTYVLEVQPDDTDTFPILDTTIHHRGILRWRLALKAPDPYYYGLTHRADAPDTSSDFGLVFPLFADAANANTGVLEFDSGVDIPQSGLLTNAGNATAYPSFTVYGDMPGGFSLTAGDLSLIWGGAVYPTAPVEIDTRLGTARVRGEDHSVELTEARWAGVAPHGTVMAVFKAKSGTGAATMILRDTYI